MIFKKITLLSVMAVLCLNFGVRAQEPIKPLKVGDKVPEIFWQLKHNIFAEGNVTTENLAKYKDKLLILDFWATWCASCIKKFAFADSLQTHYNKEVGVILVNTKTTRDTQLKVAGTLSAYAPKLQTILADTLLKQMFPHKQIPHYVWIENEYIRAFTGGDFFVKENIDQIIRQRKHNNAIIQNLNKAKNNE